MVDEVTAARRKDLLRREYRAAARQRIRDKLEAFLWVAAAGFVLAYGDGRADAFTIAREDVRVKRSWLYAALALTAANGVVFLYLAAWLPLVKGLRDGDWDKHAPWAIPASAANGVCALFAYLVAFWPVFKWWTPILEFIVFMGVILSPHFVPSFLFGGPVKID